MCSLAKGLFTRKVLSPCPLLPPLKFSIVPMVTVCITDRTDPYSLCSSDAVTWAKNVTCKQTLKSKKNKLMDFCKFVAAVTKSFGVKKSLTWSLPCRMIGNQFGQFDNMNTKLHI